MAKHYNRNTTTIVMPFLPYREAEDRYNSVERVGSLTYDPNPDPNGVEFHCAERADASRFYADYSPTGTTEPIFIVARTNNTSGPLDDTNKIEYEKLINSNPPQIAFFGKWCDYDTCYTDTSSVEATTEDEIQNMSFRFGQRVVFKIYSNGSSEPLPNNWVKREADEGIRRWLER